MPQMYPLSWFILFIYFLLLFYTFFILNFYNYQNKSLLLTKISSMNKISIWMW
uniref:ATP synthase complex subunit 8 n=1 Tax=Glossosoma caudatum TaxID=2904899 RepID=A0A9E8LNH9_9NEOP|nr:ATP synthase F0 subunit 8 [Glossosoma caudatum]UZZ43626.1 ATP synthase F0 subunit 8 [Glossosoma caudatum]